MVGLLRMNEPVDYFRFLVSSAKKTAAFFSISRSSRKTRTSRRSLRNSARSSESRLPELPVPLAPPSSGSLSHRFSETTLTPRSVAISLVLLPLSRTRRTASTLNSCGYEANRLVLIIRHVPSEHPSSSSYMSTKTGELQYRFTLKQRRSFRCQQGVHQLQPPAQVPAAVYGCVQRPPQCSSEHLRFRLTCIQQVAHCLTVLGSDEVEQRPGIDACRDVGQERKHRAPKRFCQMSQGRPGRLRIGARSEQQLCHGRVAQHHRQRQGSQSRVAGFQVHPPG